MSPRVYIAGPMTGLPEFNFPAFNKAARLWREAGWEVLNPAESFDGNTSLEYKEYVAHDMVLIKSCDAIALLPGWDGKGARGSVWEREIALMLGLKVFDAEKPEVPDISSKPTNPKDAIGSGKMPLHLWPETASALGSLALLEGALKYGRANFRAIGVRASIYYDAARRHIGAWFEGEEADPDSGLPHLAHALACLAILVDAEAAGKLNDDRQIAGGYRKHMDALLPHVARLKTKYAEKRPKHYTIADSPAPSSETPVLNPSLTQRGQP